MCLRLDRRRHIRAHDPGDGPVFESRAPGVSHLFLSGADAVGVIAYPPTSTRSSAAIGARLNALSAMGVETASQWPRRPTMSAGEALHRGNEQSWMGQ
jgi:hypothetical protein